jgi:subtilisin-like proprotein convertase family protein
VATIRCIWSARRMAGALATAALLTGAPAALADVAVEHDSTVVTETTGNGDGVIDPGETFALTENVISSEFTPLTGVSGTVTTAEPSVALSNGSSAYPDLAFGTPAGNTTPFTGTVAGDAECGIRVPFTLGLTSSGGSASIPFSMTTGAPGPASAFDSVDVPYLVPDGGYIDSVLPVSGSGRVSNLVVRVGMLESSYSGDLRLSVIAPDGTEVLLANGLGDGGSGYQGTVFDSDAATSIVSASPPFTGTFRPQGNLSVLDGQPLAGTWRLRVADESFGDFSAIEAWGLDISPAVCTPYTPPPPPPPPVPPRTPPGFDQRSDRAQGQWPDPPGFEHNSPRAHAAK